MNTNKVFRIAAAAMLFPAALPTLFAQAPTIVVAPNQLAFDLRSGIPPAQSVNVSITGTSQSTSVNVTPSSGVRVNGLLGSTNIQLPRTINVSVDPSLIGASTTQGSIEFWIPSTGIRTTLPICFIRTAGQCPGIPGGGTGFGTFNPSISQVFWSDTDLLTRQIGLTSSTGFIPTYSTTVTYNSFYQNWVQVQPSPGTLSNSTIVTVTPVTTGLPAGTYSATLNIIPQSGTGHNSIQIPITLTVGTGTGTTGFNASPSSVTFSYPAGTTVQQTASVLLNAQTATTYSASVSPNLQNVLFVQPQLGTAPTTLTLTLANPGAIPVNTSGWVTITPSSFYQSFNIPVYINPTGTSTGSLVINPTALTFSTVPGATAPQSQIINVTTTDSTQHAFAVNTSSTNGFLTAFASSTITPATVTVGINPSAISQVGTYEGFVTITPQSGLGAGVPTTVRVTVNVGTAGIVLPTPTSVALEARAGAAQPATSNVRLDVAAGVQAVNFTTAITTASGGDWLSVNTTNVAPGQITVRATAANLAAGSYTGKITVTPSNGAPFDINVTFTVTASGEIRVSPATLAFAHQTTSSSAPPSQTVQITSTGTPLNWTATATSTGGNWLQVSPASGTTGTNSLTVSVNPTGLQAGNYTGSISVSSPNATNPAQTIAVTLNVTTPVIPSVASFVNAASFGPTSASPGLIATITGTNLGPATGVTGSVGATGFPTILGETQVLFDGRPAPLLYSSASQISFVVPFEVAGRLSTRVAVEYRGQRSSEQELRVADAAPGIFTLNQSGSGQGAVLNQNGTVNGPSNPEVRGNVVVIYATGLGVVFPSVGTGTLVGTASRTTLPVRVRIGGVEATVQYAGAAPGLVGGAYQINAVIPQSVSPGSNVPVSIEAGTGLSQPTVTIAVQ